MNISITALITAMLSGGLSIFYWQRLFYHGPVGLILPLIGLISASLLSLLANDQRESLWGMKWLALLSLLNILPLPAETSGMNSWHVAAWVMYGFLLAVSWGYAFMVAFSTERWEKLIGKIKFKGMFAGKEKHLTLAVIGLIFLFTTTWLITREYKSLNLNLFFAVHDQAAWKTSRGEAPIISHRFTDRQYHYFSIHYKPYYFFSGLILRMLPHKLMHSFQMCFMPLITLPLLWMNIRLMGGDDRLSFLVCVAYLASWLTFGIAIFNDARITMVAHPLYAAFHLMCLKNRKKPALIIAIVLMSMQNIMAIAVFGSALWLFFTGSKRFGMTLLVLSILSVPAHLSVSRFYKSMIPDVYDKHMLDNLGRLMYPELGDNTAEVIKTVVFKPWIPFRHVVKQFRTPVMFIFMLLGGGVLCLNKPEMLVAAIPVFLYASAMSEGFFKASWYDLTVLVPFLFLASSSEALKRLEKRRISFVSIYNGIPYFFIAVSIIGFFVIVRVFSNPFHIPDNRYEKINKFSSTMKGDLNVTAQSSLAPLVSRRKWLGYNYFTPSDDSEAFFLDFRGPRKSHFSNQEFNGVLHMLREKGWFPVFNYYGATLIVRDDKALEKTEGKKIDWLELVSGKSLENDPCEWDSYSLDIEISPNLKIKEMRIKKGGLRRKTDIPVQIVWEKSGALLSDDITLTVKAFRNNLIYEEWSIRPGMGIVDLKEDSSLVFQDTAMVHVEAWAKKGPCKLSLKCSKSSREIDVPIPSIVTSIR